MDRINFEEDYGFGESSRPYEDAVVAILPVPYEGTVSYGKGTSRGPSAIIKASPNAEMYDFLTGRDYEKLKIATLKPLEVNRLPKEVMQRVEERVSMILTDGKFPFILGGEHSITGPAVRAVARHHGGNIGVVQLDAHADLRNDFSGTIHSHGAVMSRVREVAPAVQLGIRSCSIEEARLINEKGYSVFSPKQTFSEKNLETALKTLPKDVYLTIDVDSMDPSIMPSTGTPEPGGFTWDEVNKIIDMVASMKRVVGADIVELAPIEGLHAPDFLSAKLAFNVLSIFPGVFEDE